MHRRTCSLLVTGALVAGLGALFVPGTATAADPPPPAVVDQSAPVPLVDPASGPPGTVISVTVPGCTGIVSAALGTQDGDVIAFNEGPGPTVDLTVPADAPQGEMVVVAGCDVYNENDLNFTTFTVSAGAAVSQPHLTG